MPFKILIISTTQFIIKCADNIALYNIPQYRQTGNEPENEKSVSKNKYYNMVIYFTINIYYKILSINI